MLAEFLSKLPKGEVLFTKSKQGKDGVEIVGIYNESAMLIKGFCEVSEFPEQPFTMDPSKLINLLKVGETIEVKDNDLFVSSQNYSTLISWRLAPNTIEGIEVLTDYSKIKPFIIPKELLDRISKVSGILKIKKYTFTIKDGVLTITLTSTENVNKAKFTLKMPQGVEDINISFSPLIETVLNLDEDIEVRLYPVREETYSSMFSVKGEGWHLEFYIYPITSSSEE